MPASDATLFISDLHLSPHSPNLQALFIDFLKAVTPQVQKIYILGDLFDIWLGEDVNESFQKEIQEILQQLSAQGIELFFMSGNRDFLISAHFLEKAKCQILSDPCIIDLFGVPTLLTHGDLLCTQDLTYQRFRRIVRHPLIKALFLSLPRFLRKKIGKKLRGKSTEYQKQQAVHILDAVPSAVEKMMRAYKVKQMIHGHVHRPKIHAVKLDEMETEGRRVVLGDWHTLGSCIISTPTKLSLASYSPTTGLQIIDTYALEVTVAQISVSQLTNK